MVLKNERRQIVMISTPQFFAYLDVSQPTKILKVAQINRPWPSPMVLIIGTVNIFPATKKNNVL